MKRALISLAGIGFAVGLLAGEGRAQGADPLRPGSGAVLIPYFTQAAGNVYLLEVASPTATNTVEVTLFFYTPDTCSRTNTLSFDLSPNRVRVIQITPEVTTLTEGAILIAESGRVPGAAGGVPARLKAPVIARGIWFDVNAGVTRVVDPAIGTALAVGSNAWSAYDTASAYIWAPRDDGVAGGARVLFSCPIGQSAGTLAFDMGEAGPKFDTLKGPIAITANVFDTNERFLFDLGLQCQCLGVRGNPSGPFLIFPRLSQLHQLFAIAPAPLGLYIEFKSFACPLPCQFSTRHLGYMDVKINPSACPDGGCPAVSGAFFGRLHPGPAKDIFGNQ